MRTRFHPSSVMQTAALLGLGLAAGLGPTAGCAERPVTTLHAAPAQRPSMFVAAAVGSVAVPAMVAPSRCTVPAVVDAKTLIPDRMVAMGQLNVADTFKGVLGPTLHDAMKMAGGVDLTTHLAKCKLPASGLSRITFGIGADPDGEAAVVLEAPGLGTDATLDCLHDAIAGATGASPWTKTRAACTTTLQLVGDPMTGYVAGPDMIVLATRKVDKAVRAQLKGSGKTALRGTFRWVAKAVDTRKSMWMAVDLPTTLSAELKRMTLAADTSGVLDLRSALIFTDATVATGFGNQAASFKTMGAMVGMPSMMMDSLDVDVDGDTVSVKLTITKSDLDVLKKVAENAGVQISPEKSSKTGI